VSAVPLVCRSVRSIIKSPSGPGTRNPEASVAAFAKNSAELRCPSTLSQPARSLPLGRDHARPLRADPSHLLHFVKGLAHSY